MNARRILITGAAVLVAAGLTATTFGVAAASTRLTDSNTIVINAANDPADAQQALSGYQTATDRQFDVTAGPTYSQTPFELVKDTDGNPAASVTGNDSSKNDPSCKKKNPDCDQDVTEILSVEHEENSSWSLGGSVEVGVGFDLVGIIDTEVSAKVTAKSSWESSTSDSQDVWVTAKPGKTVWLEASSQMVNYTGNFSFTDALGQRYEVDNVSITQPATHDGDRFAGTTYRVEEVNSTIVNAVPTANNKGGLKPISQLPKLQAYIAAGH